MEHTPDDYGDMYQSDLSKPDRKGMLAIWAVFIAGLAMFLWALLADVREAEANARVDNAVIFLADVSSSMSAHELEVIRSAHAQAITSTEALTAIRSGANGRSAFAYVEFGSRAVVVVGWTVIDGPASAEEFASTVVEKRGSLGAETAIGNALVEAERLIRAMPFEADFVTVDVAGDGIRNAGVDVVVPRGLILAAGATINGLPMDRTSTDNNLVDWYRDNIIGGPRAFLLPLSSVEEMPMLLRRKLLMELY